MRAPAHHISLSIFCSAEYYPKIFGDAQYKARLKGSWEVTVGELETFCEQHDQCERVARSKV